MDRTDRQHDFSAGIQPDDPRLSEWIDGRLPAAEAAEVERLVGASAALSRVVADLRVMKAALAAMPRAPVPADFARGVMGAIAAAPPPQAGAGAAAEDAVVEAEWQRIERERIAEEIAEAREDADDVTAPPSRPRWPWITLAAALAAGMLVAVVLNNPAAIRDREVAVRDAAEMSDTPARADRGSDPAPKGSAPAPALPAAEALHQAAGEFRERENADSWLPEERAVESRSVASTSVADEARSEDVVAEPAAAKVTEDASSRVAADKANVAARRSQPPADAAAAEPDVVTVTVRGAEGRAEVAQLLAASGVRIESDAEALRTLPSGPEATPTEVVVSGSPEAIEELLAMLVDPDLKRQALNRKRAPAAAAQPLEGGEAAGGQTGPRRLVIRLVEAATATDAAAGEGPAGSEP